MKIFQNWSTAWAEKVRHVSQRVENFIIMLGTLINFQHVPGTYDLLCEMNALI